MIINLVLFFIPKRQEIYRLYLIKKRKKLAYMRLNSNTQFMLQTSSKNKNNINIVINSRCSIILLLNNYSGYLAVYAIEIDSQYNCSQIEIINKKKIKPIITVDNKILTISENTWLSALILSTIPITEIK